jgi:GAF domain-containing protein
VIPLFHQEQLIGVWDLDSPVPARFDAEDQAGMQVLCDIYMQAIYKK